MPIDEAAGTAGSSLPPVAKFDAIGQRIIGAICAPFVQRDTLDANGQPKLKANGRPRRELVVTLLAMPGITAVVGKAGEHRTIQPGDVFRIILKGGAYGSWIEAENRHKTMVPLGARPGDIVNQVCDHAQAWNEDGTKRGGQIATQAEADAVPRSVSLGYYGPIDIAPASGDEIEWDAKACQIWTDGLRPDPTTTTADTTPSPFK